MVDRFGRLRATAVGALATASILAAFFVADAAAYSPIYLDPLAGGRPPAIASTASGGVLSSIVFNNQLRFCEIEPGAGSCGVLGGVNAPSGFTEDLGDWPFVEGSTIGLLDTRRKGGGEEKKLFYALSGSGTLIYEHEVASTAGLPGSSLAFTEAAQAPTGAITSGYFLGTIEGGPISDGAILAASETVSGSGSGSKFVVSRNAANTAEGSSADAAISVQGTLLSSAYVGLFEGPQVYWRRLLGTGTPAYVQSNSHWSAPVLVGEATSGSLVRMATGPKGLYLAYKRAADGAVVLQQFNGSNGFETPVVITPAETADFAIAEDPAGLIHVAYTLEGTDARLRYRYAKDGLNQTFTNPQVLGEAEYRDLRLVGNSDGGGWVSWLDDGSDSSFVLQLAPGEPPTPTPTTPPAGGSGGGTSGGGAVKKAPPKTVTGPTATTTTPLGHGLVGELSVPKQCLPGEAIFKAKLRVKRKGTQAHKTSYSVKKVQFSLGGSSFSTDRAKPFEASFLTTGLKRDSALTVAAKVSVALHFGHRSGGVTKSLTAKVRTCG